MRGARSKSKVRMYSFQCIQSQRVSRWNHHVAERCDVWFKCTSDRHTVPSDVNATLSRPEFSIT